MAAEWTQDELLRYSRHFALPEFGSSGQERLRNSAVLVVGAGGLGCPLLMYLAAAGVGRIGIIDPDAVSLSNLHRQVLYTSEDLGRPKAEVAAKRLAALNPHVEFEVFVEALLSENALELVSRYDVVADGTDNFATRYLVNDACVLTGKINVYAALYRMEGQVAVFNYPLEGERRSTNYRDLYPDPPPPELVPNCEEGGVLGVLPGIIGAIQAAEIIKVLSGVGEPLIDTLLLWDLAAHRQQLISIPKQPGLVIEKLIFYEQLCGSLVTKPATQTMAHEIKPEILRSWLHEGKDILLIDIREPYEFDELNIGGENIPMAELPFQLERLQSGATIVLVCKTGSRSELGVKLLVGQYGLQDVSRLIGGVEGYLGGDF
ncbi:MAG: ThiF family adenylyltransferase [Saprospiraceae bacterium]|jgi:adenylyltransferase/sulfurtransferase|nr:ThiF family adenylyltransferase [Saprospiraceae bacterium]